MKLKKASMFTKLVILAVMLYAVVSIVSVRNQAAEAEQLRQALSQQVEDVSRENAALEYRLENGADDETIEEIARDKLGLVLPGEKVFYDISD